MQRVGHLRVVDTMLFNLGSLGSFNYSKYEDVLNAVYYNRAPPMGFVPLRARVSPYINLATWLPQL